MHCGEVGYGVYGDLVEALRLHEGAHGRLKKLPGAADAWIAYFTVGDRHDSLLLEGSKRKKNL